MTREMAAVIYPDAGDRHLAAFLGLLIRLDAFFAEVIGAGGDLRGTRLAGSIGLRVRPRCRSKSHVP